MSHYDKYSKGKKGVLKVFKVLEITQKVKIYSKQIKLKQNKSYIKNQFGWLWLK